MYNDKLVPMRTSNSAYLTSLSETSQPPPDPPKPDVVKVTYPDDPHRSTNIQIRRSGRFRCYEHPTQATLNRIAEIGRKLSVAGWGMYPNLDGWMVVESTICKPEVAK